ncbi:hypothetical protein [Streptomyces turgidiscabies]|uniref:hypothetical protein n=1 Tax=Streptomyces turgidiscabies TaxID=85558 RepID=UPI0038F7EA82
MILYLILAVTLSGSIGWCWGHATARVRHVPIGGTAEQDDAAFLAHEEARFNDLIAQLDLPNDQSGTAI